jgi:hypothetical protein
MGRTSRVPYHQNVFDLLQLEPAESPEAARMITEHESQHGPLPTSLREWYLVPDMVPLDTPEEAETSDVGPGTLWHDYLPHDMGMRYHVTPLADVLYRCANARLHEPEPLVEVLHTWGYYTWTWSVKLDGSDDPPVRVEPERIGHRPGPPKERLTSFSEFAAALFAEFYLNRSDPFVEGNRGAPPIHANGLWLRTPVEPFALPVIDFLHDQFGEPERTPRPGNVTTHTFRPDGGTIRVTTDEPSLAGGLSAWWVHAETPDRLAELGRLLLPWGTLRDTLRADTDPAREVLGQLRGP